MLFSLSFPLPGVNPPGVAFVLLRALSTSHFVPFTSLILTHCLKQQWRLSVPRLALRDSHMLTRDSHLLTRTLTLLAACFTRVGKG